MAMDLAPLFTRIEQLAPQFGRSEGDLLALVARGRSSDFEGAVQGARRVLEALLRRLAAEEPAPAPGEATLDELMSLVSRPPKAGGIPAPVLAHMVAVQAGGSLGPPDRESGSSGRAGKLGPEELGAVLTALLAVLAWYAQQHGPTPAPAGAGAPPPGAAKKTSPVTRAVALAIPVLGGLYAVWVVATQGPSAVEVANAGVALNKFYAANKEPPPAGRCRITDARTLVKVAASPGSLSVLRSVEVLNAEVYYLLARALAEAKQPAEEPLARALECEGFAAPHGLKAKLLGSDGKKAEAAAELERALADDQDWSAARYNLGLVELARGRVPEGAAHLQRYLAAEPGDGDGWMMLGAAYEALARRAVQARESPEALLAKAKDAFCQAEQRGKAEARPRCRGP